MVSGSAVFSEVSKSVRLHEARVRRSVANRRAGTRALRWANLKSWAIKRASSPHCGVESSRVEAGEGPALDASRAAAQRGLLYNPGGRQVACRPMIALGSCG